MFFVFFLNFRPLDLQTIKKNIETGKIRSTDEFLRDILIMLNNAIMYNKSNSPIYLMAREMQEESVAHVNVSFLLTCHLHDILFVCVFYFLHNVNSACNFLATKSSLYFYRFMLC